MLPYPPPAAVLRGRRPVIALALLVLMLPSVAGVSAAERRWRVAFANLTEEPGVTIEGTGFTGRDVHESVIQRLFGHGLALQGTASRTVNPQLRTAIQTQIDEVDAIIRDVRAAVFSLNPPPPTATPAAA